MPVPASISAARPGGAPRTWHDRQALPKQDTAHTGNGGIMQLTTAVLAWFGIKAV
jgi:hypothetical protein